MANGRKLSPITMANWKKAQSYYHGKLEESSVLLPWQIGRKLRKLIPITVPLQIGRKLSPITMANWEEP